MVATITGTDISATVPYGTDVTALVATFTTTGVSVTVGGTTQESGVTANHFTIPVTYIVEAADGSTHSYVVTVTIATELFYGDYYAGGIVFYLDGSGGGLVAAPSDQSPNIQWGGYGIFIGGTSTELGTGAANTVAIVNALGDGPYAANLCYDLELNSYDDWFLPSREAMNLMYQNLYQQGLGGFTDGFYWSSSEESSGFAWLRYNTAGTKYRTYPIRAARAF